MNNSVTTKGLGPSSVPGLALVLALALAAASGCAGGRDSQDGTNPGAGPNTPPEEDHERRQIAHTSADFGEEGQERGQLFDASAVGEEPGAEATVVDAGSDVTSFELEVSGFALNESYLATVHVQECGSAPEASGPLYEGHGEPDEAPEEEPGGVVMIKVATDSDGRGSGQVQTDHELDAGQVRSLLITTDPTEGSEQPNPQDGEPVACMDLDLDA